MLYTNIKWHFTYLFLPSDLNFRNMAHYEHKYVKMSHPTFQYHILIWVQSKMGITFTSKVLASATPEGQVKEVTAVVHLRYKLYHEIASCSTMLDTCHRLANICPIFTIKCAYKTYKDW